MGVERLLALLGEVKRRGNGRWIARCPGHDDRRPSLAIRELGDGRVLIKCFAGCATEDVLAKVGLGFDVLFPDRATGDRIPRDRPPFNAHHVLEAVSAEVVLVAVAAANTGAGIALTPAERARVIVAAERLYEAQRLTNDRR